MAYKRDIDDIRESPALDVMGLLHRQGVRLSCSDPYVPRLPRNAWPGGYDLSSVPLDPGLLSSVDCVAILTDHQSLDYASIVTNAPLIVDTRNAIREPHPHLFRLGAPHPAHAEVWQPVTMDALTDRVA